MTDFQGAAAVVTGAAGGLGRAFATELASRGARVVLADIDTEGAEQTAELVRSHGGSAYVVRCDVRHAEQMQSLVERTHEHIGTPDLVVLNAGVLVAGALPGTEADALTRLVEINLLGVVHGCNAFGVAMLERGRGCLLNVGSIAGLIPVPQLAAYAATKAAVVGFSRSLHAELRPRGVGVTVLCPSFTRTSLIANAAQPEHAVARLGQRILDLAGAPPQRVAKVGLNAAARRKLYAIDTVHARLAWGLERLAPSLTARVWARASGLLQAKTAGG